jgi:hypothetical protein
MHLKTGYFVIVSGGNSAKWIEDSTSCVSNPDHCMLACIGPKRKFYNGIRGRLHETKVAVENNEGTAKMRFPSLYSWTMIT